MASRKPIVAMLNGEGAKVIGESECGFSVPASNSTKLAEVVSHMSIMSKDSLTQMGNKGHSYYLEHFDKSSVIDNIVRHL